MTADKGNVSTSAFTPESAAALEKRGIPLSQAQALGILPALEPGDLRASLAKRWDGPGMIVLWRDLDGTVTPQYRPDAPTRTQDVNGKERVMKYLFPKGCGQLFNWLRTPSSDTSPVLVVEGALKGPAAALYAPAGLAVVAVPGCRIAKGSDLSWAAGREVLVAFDADLRSNPEVWEGGFWLSHHLMEAGATGVRFLDPEGSGKEGLDDLLGKLPSERRRDALRSWIEAAGPLPAKPIKVGGAILPNPKFASDVAAELVKEYETEQGDRTLINRDGIWFAWEGAHWTELTDSQVSTELWLRCESSFFVRYDKEGRPMLDDQGRPKLSPWNPTRSNIAELRTAMQAKLDTSRTFGTDVLDNVWLRGRSADPVMSFANGLLNLRTRKLIPHTAAYFNLSSVPYDYDPDAEAPVEWLRFLDSVWEDDAESIALLQEWFGYVLSGRLDLHAILLLVGPPRSGKSNITSILSAMIGEANNAGLTMSALGTNFGLQRAIGKMSGVIGDSRLRREDRVPVMERLLLVSAGDSIQVDRKNRTPWEGVLSMRITLVSNQIPDFADESGALAARFQTLATVHSHVGKEDRGILGRCMKELSGILAWALEGLDRLTERGYFTKPGASKAVEEISRRQAAPVSAFLDDWCSLDSEASERKEDVYEAFKAWCAGEGVEHPMKLAQMAAALFETGSGVKAKRARRDGKLVQLFIGVKLRATLKPGTGWTAPEEAEDGPLTAEQPPAAPLVQPTSDGPLETAPSAAPVEELRAVVADPFADGLDLDYS